MVSAIYDNGIGFLSDEVNHECCCSCREGNIPNISESGSITEFLIDIHKKYGPITSFWLGPTQVVSLSSPELIKQVVHLFDRPGKSSQARARPRTYTLLRPSHTITETTKKDVIFHTHYNFFSQLQRFFQQFYIWTTILPTIFSEKSL